MPRERTRYPMDHLNISTIEYLCQFKTVGKNVSRNIFLKKLNFIALPDTSFRQNGK